MLEKKSIKSKFSQSDFLRILIQDYSEKKILNKDINESIFYLSNIYANLSKLSNKINRLCYYDFVDFLNEQISNIKSAINQIKKI